MTEAHVENTGDDNPPPRVGEQRPGGRATRVRNAVLQATIDLVSEVGYDEATIDGIAARAEVHKTTIYRRWSTKSALVAAAASAASDAEIPIPDTGSLAGDLQALARSVAVNLGSNGGGRRSRSIVASAIASDQLADDMRDFWAERFQLASAVVERAVERGELQADVDPGLLIETLIGPLWIRLLLTGGPITAEVADDVAAMVAAGATTAYG
ncbi:MAG: TetR/AcrR family transcriptional regulator [Actinomycetota bacterium]